EAAAGAGRARLPGRQQSHRRAHREDHLRAGPERGAAGRARHGLGNPHVVCDVHRRRRALTRAMAVVVFDLDGTLVDSSQDLAASGNALLAEYARRPLPPDEIAAMVGEGARVLVERLFHAAGITAPVEEGLARFLALYDARLVETTRPYDGIPDL